MTHLVTIPLLDSRGLGFPFVLYALEMIDTERPYEDRKTYDTYLNTRCNAGKDRRTLFGNLRREGYNGWILEERGGKWDTELFLGC
jgi:hypothetical protein